MNIAPLPFTRSIESLTVERPAQVGVRSLTQPDAPSQKGGARRSVLSQLFSFGAPALTAIALSLAVGFGSPNTAYAQGATTSTTSCSRDAAWTAAMGSELGRGLTGDDNGGRVIGALAGIIHRLSCTDAQSGASAQALTPELQRLNTNLEEALAQPAAKYESGSDLSDHQKQILTYLSDQIRRDPSLRLVILGHANDALQVEFINEGVAKERANKAAEFLATKGIGGARMETSGVSQGDGQNRLQIAIVKGNAPQSPQPTAETDGRGGGLFGIPGLSINIGGGNRTNNPGVINRGNGTVNGGPNANGRTNNGGRVAPGPGNSGWNGN